MATHYVTKMTTGNVLTNDWSVFDTMIVAATDKNWL